MIKFSNYKTKKISEIFEGFIILSEKELEDRIKKSDDELLKVFGGLDLKVESQYKRCMLVSNHIHKGSVVLPVDTYFKKFNSGTKTVDLWFTSETSAKKFVDKFFYKLVNYTGDDINRYILIISEQ